MLFRKHIDPRCSYCAKGVLAENPWGKSVLCVRRGIVPEEHFCRFFQYNPLRRTPLPLVTLRRLTFSPADFSLESH